MARHLYQIISVNGHTEHPEHEVQHELQNLRAALGRAGCSITHVQWGDFRQWATEGDDKAGVDYTIGSLHEPGGLRAVIRVIADRPEREPVGVSKDQSTDRTESKVYHKPHDESTLAACTSEPKDSAWANAFWATAAMLTFAFCLWLCSGMAGCHNVGGGFERQPTPVRIVQ